MPYRPSFACQTDLRGMAVPAVPRVGLVTCRFTGAGRPCQEKSPFSRDTPRLHKAGCGVRLFLSRTLMKFVTFTDHQSGPDLLCDDFPAKVSLYLLLTIEHRIFSIFKNLAGTAWHASCYSLIGFTQTLTDS